MPGILGTVNGVVERFKGREVLSKSTLARIGAGGSLATLGGCLFASTATPATGTITFAVNPTVLDTITIGTTTWTFETSGASGPQTNIKATLALTLTQLVSDLIASADGQIVKATYSQSGGNTLTIAYLTPGTAGNTFALAASAATVSAATLLGGGGVVSNGADTTEDTLATVSIPQNTFDVAGRNLEVIAWGNITATSATKTVKLYLGNSIIQPIVATTTQAGAWQITANIWKAGLWSQNGFAQYDFVGATTPRTIANLIGGEPDNAALAVKVTGKSSVGTAGLVSLYGLAIYGFD